MEVIMSKSKKRDCSCRSRTPGNPKYSHGICYQCGDVRPSVAQRIAGKRLTHAWRAAVRCGGEIDD